jgi:hypothetical protein
VTLPLYLFPVDIEEISIAIRQLDLNMATGMDGIPAMKKPEPPSSCHRFLPPSSCHRFSNQRWNLYKSTTSVFYYKSMFLKWCVFGQV